jgi:hypothetical protein
MPETITKMTGVRKERVLLYYCTTVLRILEHREELSLPPIGYTTVVYSVRTYCIMTTAVVLVPLFRSTSGNERLTPRNSLQEV